MDIGLKEQNRWILRSRTEAEVQAQRSLKKGNAIYNTTLYPASLTLNYAGINFEEEKEKLFQEMSNVGGNRPKQKKAK
jgi:hypothetical protein